MRYCFGFLVALFVLSGNLSGAEEGRVIAGVDLKKESKAATLKEKRTKLGYLSEDVPAVLSASDVRLYKKMFRLQRNLQRTQVVNLVPKLKNRELMGHLIAERLLHPRTKTQYGDLKKWLSRYGDHSMAPTVYSLAKKRQPRNDKYGPKKPPMVLASVAKYSDPDKTVQKEVVKKTRKRQALLRKLKQYRQKQYYSKAIIQLSKSENKELLGQDTWAQVTLRLARSILNYGDYKRPERLARMVVNHTEFRRNEALWVAGFSNYKLGKYDKSAGFFRRLAYSVPRNSKYFAKSAFWAGKAYDNIDRASMSRVFYSLASQDADSFYGQVAAQKVGRKRYWAWGVPSIRSKDKDFLFKDPLVRRVIALSQIGEHALAQDELKLIHSRVPHEMDMSLLALASQLHLPNIQMSLARNLKEQNMVYYGGLYPEPKAWKPRGGYEMDRSLMHAIMRQESAFKPKVKSRAGARGLMQLMPNTAKFIRRKQNRPVYSRHALFNPNINMGLGQDYLQYLMTKMEGNVIQVVASYNAGPGNVNKWLEKNIGNNDPILLKAFRF
jgi:soluble lytic murein transglycosylase